MPIILKPHVYVMVLCSATSEEAGHAVPPAPSHMPTWRLLMREHISLRREEATQHRRIFSLGLPIALENNEAE